MANEKKVKFPYMYMTKTLRDIHNSEVQLKLKKRLQYTKKISEIMDIIIPKMRNADNLFNSCRPYYQFAGSFYESTDIDLPDEVNVNIVMSFPDLHSVKDKKTIRLESILNSIFFCEITPPNYIPRLSSKSKPSVDSVLTFLQEVLIKTMPYINEDDNSVIKNIMIISNEDPMNYGVSIDVDGLDVHIKLIPSFTFSVLKVPKNSPAKNFDKARPLGPDYWVIPSPLGDQLQWHITFPQQEKRLLKSKYNMKYAIRLIKVLRNAQKFEGLTNYMIKTMFLLEAEVQNPIFWMGPRGDVLMHMLRRLNNHFELALLPNYWYRNYNMFLEIDSESLRNWSGTLNNIINDIEKNGNDKPEVIVKYFKKKV